MTTSVSSGSGTTTSIPVSPEQWTAELLKRSMPFQTVSEEALKSIVQIAKIQYYKAGEIIYRAGETSDDIYIVASGKVQHTLEPGAHAQNALRFIQATGVFGFAAVLKNQKQRLATTICVEDTLVIRINGEELVHLLSRDPTAGKVVMTRFAAMIREEFTVPETFFDVLAVGEPGEGRAPSQMTGLALTMFRLSQWVSSPKPYLMLLGFSLFLGFWVLSVQIWKLPRFAEMPGLTDVIKEWVSSDPIYGTSIYTHEYYQHIWVSVRRVAIAFFLATTLGVPLGLFLGWSKKFREYVFPVFEVLRPIPILAWVPLAIIMFSSTESPVIFLTFLASFYATALNSMLGVRSIDESYIRAAACLGAGKWQVFKQVIIPGALPFVFTGLQISVGVAWFSLVAAEMVSGEFGLGYLINTSYTMVRYPTIVIGMVTLGVVGYITSAMVRMVGDYLMTWRVRELALGGK